jgi:hypothetical protein
MIICIAGFGIRIVSACFAVTAGMIWFIASRIKMPAELTQGHVAQSDGDVVPVLDRLMRGVARQSKLNALAAFCAAFAAILQVATVFMPTCWDY